MLDWYFDYVTRFKDAVTFNSNPSPGNMAGGITNIAEKVARCRGQGRPLHARRSV